VPRFFYVLFLYARHPHFRLLERLEAELLVEAVGIGGDEADALEREWGERSRDVLDQRDTDSQPAHGVIDEDVAQPRERRAVGDDPRVGDLRTATCLEDAEVERTLHGCVVALDGAPQRPVRLLAEPGVDVGAIHVGRGIREPESLRVHASSEADDGCRGKTPIRDVWLARPASA